MPHEKPTLASVIVRQHVLAAAMTLGLVMLTLLAVVDLMNMRQHRVELARDLRAIRTVETGTPREVGIVSETSTDRVGYLLLDNRGRWNTDDDDIAGRHATRQPAKHWIFAATVLRKGVLEGRGSLPWVNEPVIWAARKMEAPDDGSPVILVGWHRVSAIRAASTFTTYGAVILAIIIAFAVSTLLALRSARRVTRVIDDIAQSSSQMAAGDFCIELPKQPTEELDRVSTSITQLAHDLDATTTDLRTEHTRLMRLERLQRQFVADASHELRAPLTSMRVTLEAWQDGVIQPQEQSDALGQLLTETERLGMLVSNLLDLSRIESGREVVDPAPLCLADIAQAVADQFNQQPGARVAVDLPAQLPSIMADEEAVRRILRNLLENARRFTPADGAIRIEAVAEHGTVRMEISDTGSGINADDLPRIWDRFSRSADARAQGKAGSGLGLAIVKGLTEAMGGTVAAESVTGQGTTIAVTLPQADPVPVRA